MDITLASATPSRVPVGATVLIPLGATAARAEHLPLDADTEIAVAVAELAAKMLRRRRCKIVVAAAIPYGTCGRGPGVAGSTSVGARVFDAFLSEIIRSMQTWAGRVVVVSLTRESAPEPAVPVSDSTAEQCFVAEACLSTALHALGTNDARTSLMMYLRPWEVRLPRSTEGLEGEVLASCSADVGADILDGLAWSVVRAVLAEEDPTAASPAS